LSDLYNFYTGMNLVILCHNYHTNLHYIFAKDMMTLITIYLIDFYLF